MGLTPRLPLSCESARERITAGRQIIQRSFAGCQPPMSDLPCEMADHPINMPSINF
jgi:hypothetical protein